MADPRVKRLCAADRQRCKLLVDELLQFGLHSFTLGELQKALRQTEEEDKAMVLVRVSGLSGDVYSERKFEIKISIEDLKNALMPDIPVKTSKETQLKLFFDGGEVDDSQTLAGLVFEDFKAGEVDDSQTLAGLVLEDFKEVNFTALVYDPHALMMMEINDMHREAIERSHREAEIQREELLERRKELIARRKQQVEAEFAATQAEPKGPLLMLTAEPASLPTKPENAKEAPIKSESLEGASNTSARSKLEKAQSEVPLLMLAAEAANPPQQCENLPDVTGLSATSDWHAKANEVVESYNAFFDHISYRKGWKEPPFSREEVAPCFVTAARVVARARIEILDARDAGVKIRQVEGSARDWMHSPECAQLLKEDRHRFAKELVHATFKDGRGYVEGLAASEVDGFIKDYT